MYIVFTCIIIVIMKPFVSIRFKVVGLRGPLSSARSVNCLIIVIIVVEEDRSFSQLVSVPITAALVIVRCQKSNAIAAQSVCMCVVCSVFSDFDGLR